MKLHLLAATATLIALAPAVSAQTPPVSAKLGAAERAAIFKAAGAVQRGGKWIICKEDPQAYGANIADVRDLNGDGRLEAVVTEDGTFCHGNTGTGFQLLSKQANGGWRVMTSNSGIPEFLKTSGIGGWPDISIGGPGFCFPLERWNGKEYVLHRTEYEGKPCRMNR